VLQNCFGWVFGAVFCARFWHYGFIVHLANYYSKLKFLNMFWTSSVIGQDYVYSLPFLFYKQISLTQCSADLLKNASCSEYRRKYDRADTPHTEHEWILGCPGSPATGRVLPGFGDSDERWCGAGYWHQSGC